MSTRTATTTPTVSARSRTAAAAVNTGYGNLTKLVVALCISLLRDGFTRLTLSTALYELFGGTSAAAKAKYNSVYITAKRAGYIRRRRAANTRSKIKAGAFPGGYVAAVRLAIAKVNAEFTENFTFDVSVARKGNRVVAVIK